MRDTLTPQDSIQLKTFALDKEEGEHTFGVAPAALTVAMATAISVGLSGSSGCADCERNIGTPGPVHTTATHTHDRESQFGSATFCYNAISPPVGLN